MATPDWKKPEEEEEEYISSGNSLERGFVFKTVATRQEWAQFMWPSVRHMRYYTCVHNKVYLQGKRVNLGRCHSLRHGSLHTP